MKFMHNLKTQRNVFIFCAILIPTILMLTFTYYPAAKLVGYSFIDWNGMASTMNFVGVKNWIKLFSNTDALSPLGNSVYYIVGGLVQNALALLIALILNNKQLKGRNFLRGIIVLPFILNGTAVSYMFRYIYDFSKGPLNKLLQLIGLAPISWLGNPATVNWALAAVAMWRYTGYLMIIYLAGLQSIPTDHYEAAQIDGASSWQSFRFITLPQLTEVIKLQMFLNISGAVMVFDLPFVITSGGPMGSSMTLAMRANELAFSYNNYGLASAYGVFCTIVIIIIYVAQDKILYREGSD